MMLQATMMMGVSAFTPPGFIIKPSNTVRTGSTFGIDPHLQFPVLANKLYRLHCTVYVNQPSASGTPGMKCRFSLDVAGSGRLNYGVVNTGGTTHQEFSTAASTGMQPSHFDDNSSTLLFSASLGSTTTTIGKMIIDGYFTPTADGTAGLYWGLNNTAAGGSAQVRADSWLYIYVEDP